MSHQITQLDESAEPLLSAARGRDAEFRLHILMELLPSLREGWGDEVEDAGAGARSRVGTSYVRSERLRLAYLRMAKAVLSFIARVQDRPELAKRIKLRYGRHIIPWNDYFFDLDQYVELHNCLASHGQHRRKPGENRPVALAAEIAGGRVTPTKFGHWQIRCRAVVCPANDGSSVAIRPVFYAADQILAETIARERHVLICGVPTLGEFRQPMKQGLKPCADVSLDIINRAQVCRYSPMLKQSDG